MKTLALVGLVASAVTVAACDERFHLVGTSTRVDGGADATANPAPDGSAGGTGGAPGTGGQSGSPVDAAVGAATTPLAISPREALTRVTRVLWESPPDTALVTMADSGAVTTNADVRRIARELLADPRSRVGVAHFYRWWLNLERMATTTKDPALFPQFSSDVGSLMVAETEAFGVDVTLNGDGRFPSLMRASYSFLNQSLAGLYGVSGVTGPDLRRVDLDPTQRAGIFTHLSFMTINSSHGSWTSPSHRGAVIADKMLCAGVIFPPEEAEIAVPPDGDASHLTNRQRLEQVLSPPSCGGFCHGHFDPLGLAYEQFDSIGRVRLTDAGQRIDASGQLPVYYGAPLPFEDAIGLAGILADLPTAHRCMGSKWLAYMVGRDLTAEDGPSVTGIHELFTASNLNLAALIAAAASSPAFLQAAGGPPCTPGLDQTCNDDPAVSSLRGACTPAGKCVCREDALLDQDTGRCK